MKFFIQRMIRKPLSGGSAPSSRFAGPRQEEPVAARFARLPLAADEAAQRTLIRSSRGLEYFLQSIPNEEGAPVLDLCGANQYNLSFLTGMGHRVFTENLVRSLDTHFGDTSFYETQQEEERVSRFLAECLDYPSGQFAAVLVWDALQFMIPSLFQRVVNRLAEVARPGAPLLATFDASEHAEYVVAYSYRILDARTLQLCPVELRRRVQAFNNRSVERMLGGFHGIRFFLARDQLREVVFHR